MEFFNILVGTLLQVAAQVFEQYGRWSRSLLRRWWPEKNKGPAM